MDDIIQESEVCSGRWLNWGLKLKWELTLLLSTTQMGGVIAWPTSSTPRAGHVT